MRHDLGKHAGIGPLSDPIDRIDLVGLSARASIDAHHIAKGLSQGEEYLLMGGHTA